MFIRQQERDCGQGDVIQVYDVFEMVTQHLRRLCQHNSPWYNMHPFILALLYIVLIHAVTSLQRPIHLFHFNTAQKLSFDKNDRFSSAQNQTESTAPNNNAGIRLNKIFSDTLSRRKADALIRSGRVTVNGESVADSPGVRVTFNDRIELDGKPFVGWMKNNSNNNTEKHYYIKYWKPKGVTCTTDRRIRGNILDAIESSPTTTAKQRLPKKRIFPVGRLDKDTSGLILLTTDGRVPNSVLRGHQKQPKTYMVQLDRPLTASICERLETGVVITTQAQRDGKNRPEPLTAATLPCHAQQLSDFVLQVTIVEGRNRQVRKMLGALGYTVMNLHRTSFMGMDLTNVSGPTHWQFLSEDEQSRLEAAIAKAKSATN
jgi:23S rRNA pseudouridine2604 synthase